MSASSLARVTSHEKIARRRLPRPKQGWPGSRLASVRVATEVLSPHQVQGSEEACENLRKRASKRRVCPDRPPSHEQDLEVRQKLGTQGRIGVWGHDIRSGVVEAALRRCIIDAKNSRTASSVANMVTSEKRPTLNTNGSKIQPGEVVIQMDVAETHSVGSHQPNWTRSKELCFNPVAVWCCLVTHQVVRGVHVCHTVANTMMTQNLFSLDSALGCPVSFQRDCRFCRGEFFSRLHSKTAQQATIASSRPAGVHSLRNFVEFFACGNLQDAGSDPAELAAPLKMLPRLLLPVLILPTML